MKNEMKICWNVYWLWIDKHNGKYKVNTKMEFKVAENESVYMYRRGLKPPLKHYVSSDFNLRSLTFFSEFWPFSQKKSQNSEIKVRTQIIL